MKADRALSSYLPNRPESTAQAVRAACAVNNPQESKFHFGA